MYDIIERAWKLYKEEQIEDSQTEPKPAPIQDYYLVSYKDRISDSLFEWKVGFWCFNPGIIFRNLLEKYHVRSIILTSGTLSPLDVLEKELQIEFKYKLVNPHVI